MLILMLPAELSSSGKFCVLIFNPTPRTMHGFPLLKILSVKIPQTFLLFTNTSFTHLIFGSMPRDDKTSQTETAAKGVSNSEFPFSSKTSVIYNPVFFGEKKELPCLPLPAVCSFAIISAGRVRLSELFFAYVFVDGSVSKMSLWI